MNVTEQKDLLSQKVVQLAVSTWFPNIKYEKKQYDRGRIPKTRMFDVSLEEGDTDQVKPGQWYVKPYSLRYRPSGHKDKMLKAWYDILADRQGNSYQNGLFVYLSNKEQPGQCSRCHSVDQINGLYRVNWNQRSIKTNLKFTHKSHVLDTKDSACKTCHKLKAQSRYLEAYKTRSPVTKVSNFNLAISGHN